LQHDSAIVAGIADAVGRFIGTLVYAESVSEIWPTGGKSRGSSNQVGELMNDAISDQLVRIQNASRRLFEKVDIPSSRMKVAIARILKAEGFIANYKVMEDARKHPFVRVYLKYASNKQPVIQGVKRISRPGLRNYRPYKDFAKRGEAGAVLILSTSKGLLTDRQAYQAKVGGEVLCRVW
jgi:small subunit ribosomal protein S8